MKKVKDRVIEIVSLVPSGNVVSYGQVALMLGYPRAAQMVGQVLNNLEDEIVAQEIKMPWWRVINNSGRISIKGTRYHDAIFQRDLLRKEGIVVLDDFSLEIEKYRFRPSFEFVQRLNLSEDVLSLLSRYF